MRYDKKRIKMKLENIKKEFKVYIVEPNNALLERVREVLTKSGFNITVFLTAEDTLKDFEKAPPHIVVTSIDLPQITGLALLKHIKQLSDDILVILITSDKKQGIQNGAYECIDSNQLETNLINVLNRAIEKLYLQFQNEQLLEEREHRSTSHSTNPSPADHSKILLAPIHQLIDKASVLTSTHEVIYCFAEQLFQLMNQPILYLKYVPTHTSLLLTHLSGLNINNFKNTGIHLKGEPLSYLEQIQRPQNFKQLQEFITSVFHVESYDAIPVSVDKNILGIIVILDKLKDQHKSMVDTLLPIFKGFLEKVYFQERVQGLMAFDLSTGTYSKTYFTKILDREMSRAIRIKHPLSLLYISIDDFDVYTQRNGEQMSEVLLRMVGHICIKTSRKMDSTARFQKGEFVMLLPHTDKERAAIKAERLRRTIFNAQFPYSNAQPLGSLSISIGVSEYPMLSSDATSLLQMADNALYQVKKSKKNRVCLGVAPQDFKPEFTYLS